MKLIKMNYKGVNFEVNPSSLELSFEKNLSVKRIPFASSKVQEMNILPEKITGKGKFVGENAREKAHQLERVFKSKGSDYLFVPNATPIKAFFTSLSLSYDSREDSVSYTFEFVEDSKNRENKYNFGYTYAMLNESLYDIANRTGVDVETLVELNDFEDLFSLRKGDKVWLS